MHVTHVRLRALRMCGEAVALMLGLAGAALCMAMGQPATVAAPDLERSFEVDVSTLSHPNPVSCERGYSTVMSVVEVYDRPEDVLALREASRHVIDLETAVCFAEEHYLGEGQARLANFEIDSRVQAPVWVIMGLDGRVVTVSARR